MPRTVAATASDTPQAELQLDEGIDRAPIAQARMVGSQAFVWLYQGLGLVVGLVAGTLLAFKVPIAMIVQDWLVPMVLPMQALIVLGGVFGWATGLSLAQKRHRAKFLAGIRARGAPESIVAHYAVEASGLQVSTPRISYLVAWDAILEIVPSPDAWLVQVDLTTLLLAKRAFADEAQERAFLEKVLARIRPEARERSVEAVAFTEGSAAA